MCLLQHATLTYMALQLGASAAYSEVIATAACFYNEGFTMPAIKVLRRSCGPSSHNPPNSTQEAKHTVALVADGAAALPPLHDV